MDIIPFNAAAHDHLLAAGYAHVRHEADHVDSGTGETGPRISFFPAYDEYQGVDEYVFVTERGVADHEPRDADFEAWADAQFAASEADHA